MDVESVVSELFVQSSQAKSETVIGLDMVSGKGQPSLTEFADPALVTDDIVGDV